MLCMAERSHTSRSEYHYSNPILFLQLRIRSSGFSVCYSSQVLKQAPVPKYIYIYIYWISLVWKLGELFANIPQLYCELLFLHPCNVTYVVLYRRPVPHSCRVVIMFYFLLFVYICLYSLLSLILSILL